MKRFVLSINSKTQEILSFDGSDLFVLTKGDNGGSFSLRYTDQTIDHNLFYRDAKKIIVNTYNGGVLPIYYRLSEGIFLFSNHAVELIRFGETVGVKTQAVLQKITGTSSQINNVFSDIHQLEETSTYEIENGVIRFHASSIKESSNPSSETFANVLKERFRKYDATSFAVLLSGGYDSRLNLALALHAANGQDVRAFHEYKDEKEFSIANNVANLRNVPLMVRKRDCYAEYARNLSADNYFVRYYGMNRDNVRRWSGYMQEIGSSNPGTQIIGMGAEPHKGKYYKQVSNLDKDLLKLFRFSYTSEKAISELINTPKYHDFQTEQIQHYIEQSKSIYHSSTSCIDFVHYHTYVVNGYGSRNQYFFNEFNIDFPMFSSELLEHVFSINRKNKEDFLLVRELLEKLDSELYSLPFTTGNLKSITPPPSLVDRILGRIRAARKSPGFSPEMDLRISERSPQSELTRKLKLLLETKTNYIKVKDIVMMMNYFTLLEETLSVDFKFV